VRAQVQAALRQASSQVQAAVAEAAAAPGGPGGAAAAAGAAPGSPSRAAAVAATLMRQGSAGGRRAAAPLLPEGLEVSLLYVRFRAAAEPGIRGARPAAWRAPRNCAGGLPPRSPPAFCAGGDLLENGGGASAGSLRFG
jgi:hypothetical protein